MNLCLSNQGCYSSICEDGMLKIIIENATFTCHEAGQVIDVALVKAEEWLHEGSIICPSCTVGNLTLYSQFDLFSHPAFSQVFLGELKESAVMITLNSVK